MGCNAFPGAITCRRLPWWSCCHRGPSLSPLTISVRGFTASWYATLPPAATPVAGLSAIVAGVAAVATVAVHNGFDSAESDHRNDRQQPRQRRASAATAATDTKITNDDSKQENTMVVGRSALPPPELTNQTALITGGTAGIGLAVARLQVREGAAVIVSGRDRERGQKAVNDISGNIRVVQADLAHPGRGQAVG